MNIKYAQTLSTSEESYRCGSILQQRLMRFRDEAKEARRTLRSTCDPALAIATSGEDKDPVIKANDDDAFKAVDEALVAAMSCPPIPLTTIPSKPGLPRPCHKALIHTFCDNLDIKFHTTRLHGIASPAFSRKCLDWQSRNLHVATSINTPHAMTKRKRVAYKNDHNYCFKSTLRHLIPCH